MDCTPGGDCTYLDDFCIDGSCPIRVRWRSRSIDFDDGAGTTCHIPMTEGFEVADVVVGNIDGSEDVEIVYASGAVIMIHETRGPDCPVISFYVDEDRLTLAALMLTDIDGDSIFDIVAGGEDPLGSEIRLFIRNLRVSRYEVDDVIESSWSGGGRITNLDRLPDADVIRGCESDLTTCYCMTFTGETVDVCPSP